MGPVTKRRICWIVLAVNGAVLILLALVVSLLQHVDIGEFPMLLLFLLFRYCIFVLPVTTVVCAVTLCSRGKLRKLAAFLVAIGALLLLANHTVLVLGIKKGTAERDESGNIVVDSDGNPVIRFHPTYLAYKERQAKQSVIALCIMGSGAACLAVEAIARRVKAKAASDP